MPVSSCALALCLFVQCQFRYDNIMRLTIDGAYFLVFLSFYLWRYDLDRKQIHGLIGDYFCQSLSYPSKK